MRNIKLVLSYDGTDYCGWQTQTGLRTIQETVQNAIATVTGDERVRCRSSGRTDSGVHAVGQVVNFLTESNHSPEAILQGTNWHLPEDIVVRQAAEMPLSFDANTDALRKVYRYVIHDGPVVNLFMRRFSTHSKWPMDVHAMRRAAIPLVGRHDFHSFESNWPNRETSIRTITHLTVNRIGEFLWIDIEADGFLYNMARSIAGTLMYVGRGYWPVERVSEILNAEDRREAGPTAPPEGLFLMRVTYA